MRKVTSEIPHVHRAWLRDLRKKNNLTILGLADLMGVTKQYISDIEHGRRNPSFKITMALSKLLGFPMERMYVDALDPQKSKEA